MNWINRPIFRALLATTALAGAVAAHAIDSAQPRSEWPLLGGNSDQWQYSGLDQINDKNVGKLGLAWVADMPVVQGLVGNPLVRDGIVYQGAPGGRVIANDVRTGKLLWMFTPEPVNREKFSRVALWASHFNRGMTVDQQHAYIASGDCRLFAVDRRSGKLVWEAAACDPTKDYGIPGGPRVGGGIVFIGNTNAEAGTQRGHVNAFDAATGRHLWRFYTTPGNPADGFENPAMELASRTWSENYWREGGGASGPWEGITYDEKLDRVYVGVGDPYPASSGVPQGGKNRLFANSILALDAKTGRLIWYYQVTSGEVPCGCDAVAHIQIADLPSRGGTRRVVMQAAKNGFFYVIDAQTGTLISANHYTADNWAYNLGVGAGGVGSGHTWPLMAYNPNNRLVYIPASGVGLAGTDDYMYKPDEPVELAYLPDSKGMLIAWDPMSQRQRWRVEHAVALNGGALATAGNLVFQGTAAGTFNAYAADTGKRLWTFDAHGTILGAPATVEIDGDQIILVPSGDGSANAMTVLPKLTTTPTAQGRSRLLAFKLGAHGSVAPTPVQPMPRPFRSPQPEALARRGAELYSSLFCWACHGANAERAGTAIPDLRRSSRAAYDAMEAIVIKGAYRQLGMPGYPNVTPSDIEAIQAFLTNQAWAAYNSEQATMQPRSSKADDKRSN